MPPPPLAGMTRRCGLVDACVNDFLEFLAVEKGASGNTIAAYRNDLSQLEAFVATRGNGSAVQWQGIGKGIILDYVMNLKSKAYAESTVARKVAAVKSFFSYLQAEGKLATNPVESLASPKVGKSLPRPLSPQEIDELLEHIHQGRPGIVGERPETALFVNRRGERLTRQGFWLILKGYAREAGIEGRVTPHTLRHSFATHMLRGGMDIHKVQELLGHANISTTQVYTQISREHIREAYEKAHPRPT